MELAPYGLPASTLAAAGRTIFARTSFIDLEIATAEVIAIESADGVTARIVILHFHEAETKDDATVTIDFGTFLHCVQTEDFQPPEPDALEHKFYAPGIGFIYETKEGEDETVELISYSGL